MMTDNEKVFLELTHVLRQWRTIGFVGMRGPTGLKRAAYGIFAAAAWMAFTAAMKALGVGGAIADLPPFFAFLVPLGVHIFDIFASFKDPNYVFWDRAAVELIKKYEPSDRYAKVAILEIAKKEGRLSRLFFEQWYYDEIDAQHNRYRHLAKDIRRRDGNLLFDGMRSREIA